MKTKSLLSVLAFALMLSAFGQRPTIELTFSAQNNGIYMVLDSILTENLSQGGDTMLYAPDTVLILDYLTGIANNGDKEEGNFRVSQNYPNPFRNKTNINIYLDVKDEIEIMIRDILGRELLEYKCLLNRGNHTFIFYPGDEKVYMLSVIGKQGCKTIKMFNLNDNEAYGGKCKIVYNNYEAGNKDLKNYDATNNFAFVLGDELKYTAFSENGEISLIDTPVGNQNYTFQYAGGVPCPGMPTISDIEGNQYKTVLIGSQCWMAENLKTTIYRDGNPIPNVTNGNEWTSLETGAYAWYDNDIAWKEYYGALYNWYTVNDSSGLCPSGWHVPDDDEWTIMIDFIGGVDLPHGNELKTCRQVYSPLEGDCNTSQHPRWYQNNTHFGTDKYGFSGLPGGYRYFGGGSFSYLEKVGTCWSSSEGSSSSTFGTMLGYDNGSITRMLYYKQYGFSVRCIRD